MNGFITKHFPRRENMKLIIQKSGFTLIELMITISILATLVMVAVPSFQNLIARNQLIATTNDLITALALARQKSVTFSRDVYLCELLNEDTCNEDRPFNADWTKGWMVFIDNNQNGTLDNNDTISHLSYHPSRSNKKNLAIVFNQQGRLRFRPDGSARSAGFYLCTPRHHKHVFLLYSGRTRHNEHLDENQIKKCHEKLFS